MTKVVCIVQARLASSRLPAKVLLPLNGHTVLEEVLRRCKRIPGVHEVVAAIPDNESCDILLPFIERQHVAVTRGPEHDVLARYTKAAQEHDADVVMRITSDCPLINPVLCGSVLARMLRDGVYYCSNVHPRTFPQGWDCEVFTSGALHRADMEVGPMYSLGPHGAAWDNPIAQHDREHVTPFMLRDKSLFKSSVTQGDDQSAVRWTLDTLADYVTITRVFNETRAD